MIDAERGRSGSYEKKVYVVREQDDARGSLLSSTLALPLEQRPKLSF